MVTENSNMIFRIMICDDNVSFACHLRKKIEAICALENWSLECSVFYNAHDAMATNVTGFKVAFLDIEMPRGNGIELAKCLREKNPELILVFVTAYIEYAPSGYKVDAFRYLLKSSLDAELHEVLNDIQKKLYADDDLITLKSQGDEYVVRLKEVKYFEGTAHRRVIAHIIHHCQPIVCLGKLSEFDESLSAKGFLRIQKSFLVNMQCIKYIKCYYAFLIDGDKLKVSESNYAVVREKFLLWKGNGI